MSDLLARRRRVGLSSSSDRNQWTDIDDMPDLKAFRRTYRAVRDQSELIIQPSEPGYLSDKSKPSLHRLRLKSGKERQTLKRELSESPKPIVCNSLAARLGQKTEWKIKARNQRTRGLDMPGDGGTI